MVLLECANNPLDEFPHRLFIVALIKSIDDNDQFLLHSQEGDRQEGDRTDWFDNQFLELVCRRFSGDMWIGFNRILNRTSCRLYAMI